MDQIEDLQLSRMTTSRRTNKLSADVFGQLKNYAFSLQFHE